MGCNCSLTLTLQTVVESRESGDLVVVKDEEKTAFRILTVAAWTTGMPICNSVLAAMATSLERTVGGF